MGSEFKVRPQIEDFQRFYRQLFKPVEKQLGPLDEATLTSLLGFQVGGPVSLSTVGAEAGDPFVTYLSCELACYRGQKASSQGPFEVMVTSNDEGWARAAITTAGRISFDAALDAGHSLDLGPALDEPDANLQGLVLERYSTTRIAGKKYGILRGIGVTRRELEWCLQHSVKELVERLKAAGVHPRSDVRRKSIRLKEAGAP